MNAKTHNFDWDDVRIFLAIVEHGSLSQAAAKLEINQSTVSRRISGLESRLDVSLFERNRGSRWAVTAAGEQMLRAAELMNDSANAISREVLSNNTEVRGHVTVTFAEVGATHIAVPALAALTKQYPELELTFNVSPDQLDLAARQADVAIRIANEVPDDVVATRICTASVGIYGTQAWYDRYRDGERNLPLMSWYKDGDYTAWLRDLFPEGRILYRSNSTAAIREMARQGACVIPLSCFEGDSTEDLVRFTEIPIMGGPGLWVISHADLRTTARVRLVRDALVDQLMAARDRIEVMGDAPPLAAKFAC